MNLDQRYTHDDHEFRESDPYAGGKYALTSRWLATHAPAPGTLYHVGCGAGLYNRRAAQLGYSVRAFEPDPDARALAEASVPEGCTVGAEPVELIPGEAVADVIVMHDVLEHIADDAAATEHLRRILKPGGLLVLSVPAMPALFGYHDEQLGHHRRYTARTLRAVLEPHFEIETCRSYGMLFIPITWLLSRRLRRPYPTGSVSGGPVAAVLRGVCALESRVPTPIGTSLIVRARARG